MLTWYLHKIPVQTQLGFTLFTMGLNEEKGGCVYILIFCDVIDHQTGEKSYSTTREELAFD